MIPHSTTYTIVIVDRAFRYCVEDHRRCAVVCANRRHTIDCLFIPQLRANGV